MALHPPEPFGAPRPRKLAALTLAAAFAVSGLAGCGGPSHAGASGTSHGTTAATTRPVTSASGQATASTGSTIPASSSTTTANPTATTTPDRSRVSVPILVTGGDGTRPVLPTVMVRVGSGRTVPVLLDTGSTGLQLFSAAVPSAATTGVTLSATPDRISYAGGHRFVGVVSHAVVTVGATPGAMAATSQPVAFGLVQSATCQATKPTCPTAHGMQEAIAAGWYGILGIGMGRGPENLLSPLLDLHPGLAGHWAVHLDPGVGSLTLGPADPDAAATATFTLHQAGIVAGHALWDDARVPVCASAQRGRSAAPTVTSAPAAIAPTASTTTLPETASACAAALFDTGTPSLQLIGPPFTTLGVGSLPTRSRVSVSTSSGSPPFWRLTSGAPSSTSHALVKAAVRPYLNLGAPPFFAFTIAYDAIQGTVTLTN